MYILFTVLAYQNIKCSAFVCRETISIFICGWFAVEVTSVQFSSVDGRVVEKTFLLDRGRLKLDILKAAFASPYLILDLGESIG